MRKFPFVFAKLCSRNFTKLKITCNHVTDWVSNLAYCMLIYSTTDPDDDDDFNYHYHHVNMTLSWIRTQFRYQNYYHNKSKLIVPLYHYKGIIGYKKKRLWPHSTYCTNVRTILSHLHVLYIVRTIHTAHPCFRCWGFIFNICSHTLVLSHTNVHIVTLTPVN